MTENAMTELLANADALLADFGLSTDFAADFVFNSLSFENDGLKAGDVEKSSFRETRIHKKRHCHSQPLRGFTLYLVINKTNCLSR